MAKATVLGAGNAGQTFAYHLSSKGHEVCLYEHPDFAKALDAILANGNNLEALAEFKKGDLVIKGLASGVATVAKISKDIKEAMAWADTIIMPVPAFAQANIFQAGHAFLARRASAYHPAGQRILAYLRQDDEGSQA